MDFQPFLIHALLCDYFNVNYLIGQSRGLDFLCSRHMAGTYKALFDEMDLQYTALQCEQDPENYMFFVFATDDDKERLEDHFQDFNWQARTAANIAKPDLYEGKAEIDTNLSSLYLGLIENFFEGQLEGHAYIPVGFEGPNHDPADYESRKFAIYTVDGFEGEKRVSEFAAKD